MESIARWVGIVFLALISYGVLTFALALTARIVAESVLTVYFRLQLRHMLDCIRNVPDRRTDSSLVN